jgi:hypothetical protein
MSTSLRKKKNNQLIIIVLYIGLMNVIACQPPVTFTEPQPSKTKNIAAFPLRLQGNYVGVDDQSTLLISEKLIQQIYDFDEKIHQNQLDSNYKLIKDTIINSVTNEKRMFKRLGDSLLTHVHYIDTVFQMDDDNVVRKFKGHYFLNMRYESDSWEVKQLSLSKGQLSINRISTEKDIENLQTITESPQDSVPPYTFTATKKQFKQFVQSDGFSTGELFIRIQ